MDEDTFADEIEEAAEALAEEPAVNDEPDDEARNGRRHGPGFLMGLFVGVAAGAVVAILSSPSEDEDGLRGRLRQAAEEGREAAQEKEAELRSRYDELTQ
jgi:hypothetical protein